MAAMFTEPSLLRKEKYFEKQKSNGSLPKCIRSHDQLRDLYVSQVFPKAEPETGT